MPLLSFFSCKDGSVVFAGISLIGKDHGAFGKVQFVNEFFKFRGIGNVGRGHMSSENITVFCIDTDMGLISVIRLLSLFYPGCVNVIGV